MRTNLSIRSLLFALLLLAIPAASSAQIILSIGFAPPPLPVYVQPACPSEGYIWTPGYWAYAQEGYFWVPGTWAMAPEPGLLWTPGYWGWGDNAFVFNEGYWGAQIGFYGGINYGYGYAGVGYQGGYWNHGAFFYNRSVNNVTNVTNVYTKNVTVNNVTVVSYNGGAGGLAARPKAAEETARNEKHVPATSVQTQHVQSASSNHQLYESVNHGKPAIAATAKPGEFSGSGVVAAKAAAPSYKPAAARTTAPVAAKRSPSGPASAVHPKPQPQQAKLTPSQAQRKQPPEQKPEPRPAQQKAAPAKPEQVEQKRPPRAQPVAQKQEAQKPAPKAPAAKAEKKEN